MWLGPLLGLFKGVSTNVRGPKVMSYSTVRMCNRQCRPGGWSHRWVSCLINEAASDLRGIPDWLVRVLVVQLVSAMPLGQVSLILYSNWWLVSLMGLLNGASKEWMRGLTTVSTGKGDWCTSAWSVPPLGLCLIEEALQVRETLTGED